MEVWGFRESGIKTENVYLTDGTTNDPNAKRIVKISFSGRGKDLKAEPGQWLEWNETKIELDGREVNDVEILREIRESQLAAQAAELEAKKSITVDLAAAIAAHGNDFDISGSDFHPGYGMRRAMELAQEIVSQKDISKEGISTFIKGVDVDKGLSLNDRLNAAVMKDLLRREKSGEDLDIEIHENFKLHDMRSPQWELNKGDYNILWRDVESKMQQFSHQITDKQKQAYIDRVNSQGHSTYATKNGRPGTAASKPDGRSAQRGFKEIDGNSGFSFEI